MIQLELFRNAALSCLLLFALPAFTQDEMSNMSEDRIQEIKAMKSAYLTSRMGLTSEEAQQFWPIYNQYDTELETVRKEMHSARRSLKKSIDQLTEEEAAKMIDNELAFRQRELDVRKKYAAIFKKQIGAIKTAGLYKAENEFNRELLKRYKEQDGGRSTGGGKGPRGN